MYVELYSRGELEATCPGSYLLNSGPLVFENTPDMVYLDGENKIRGVSSTNVCLSVARRHRIFILRGSTWGG